MQESVGAANLGDLARIWQLDGWLARLDHWALLYE